MSIPTDERVALRLTGAPVVIRANGFVPIDYRMIREAAINGLIPAFQRNGIWHFYPADIGQIAAGLRLVRRTQSVTA